MGVLFSVLVVVGGAAALVLPRLLRGSSSQEREADDRGKPGRPQPRLVNGASQAESPSRRFAAVSQRVGRGGGVAPEPLREASGSIGWQPEMGSGFHQTTAYPEPPARYESAEEQSDSRSRPVATTAAKPTADAVRSN